MGLVLAVATAFVVAAQAGALSHLVAWGAALLVFAIRMVAVVLHLNAPQPSRPGEPR